MNVYLVDYRLKNGRVGVTQCIAATAGEAEQDVLSWDDVDMVLDISVLRQGTKTS